MKIVHSSPSVALTADEPAHSAGIPAQTIVSFHAHPDDEALLTGGTLARLAVQGHRVVLVVATVGEAGLTAKHTARELLAAARRVELRRSAEALGCARVVLLGYPDSGWSTDSDFVGNPGGFASIDAAGPAARLAEVLIEESADILTIYDRHGGYGHPDHLRVHDVGVAAAALAGTPRVLEATIDRTMLRRAIRLLTALHLVPAGTPLASVDSWFSGRDEITHRVSVRWYSRQKRAALASHASQARGGDGPRTLAILLKLPRPVFRRVCGTEWFIERGTAVPSTPLSDPLVAAAKAVSV